MGRAGAQSASTGVTTHSAPHTKRTGTHNGHSCTADTHRATARSVGFTHSLTHSLARSLARSLTQVLCSNAACTRKTAQHETPTCARSSCLLFQVLLRPATGFFYPFSFGLRRASPVTSTSLLVSSRSLSQVTFLCCSGRMSLRHDRLREHYARLRDHGRGTTLRKYVFVTTVAGVTRFL